MDRIVYSNSAGTEGMMQWEGGKVFGPLPPLSAEYRGIYDDLISKGVVPEHAPDSSAATLSAYASAKLASMRDGGVLVGGVRIKTDAESRGLINGADALSQRDPGVVIDFKAATGWVKLDAETMQAIALAVGRWVQACYSVYRDVSEGIASGAVVDVAQVDSAFAALDGQE